MREPPDRQAGQHPAQPDAGLSVAEPALRPGQPVGQVEVAGLAVVHGRDLAQPQRLPVDGEFALPAAVTGVQTGVQAHSLREISGVEQHPANAARVQMFADLGGRPVASFADHKYYRLGHGHAQSSGTV